MKKIISFLITIILISSTTIVMGNILKKNETLANPPKDIVWPFNSPKIADWLGADINAGGHSGRIESVEDTNGDGNVSYCDFIVINWRNLNMRQHYWKYHCEKRTYVEDPEDPDYGSYRFELDYKSKTNDEPKIEKNSCWVDDDNIMGPWDGSFEHPYQDIQDAIDGATNRFGHIVVNPGEYGTFYILEGDWSIGANAFHDDYPSQGVIVNGEGSGTSTITLGGDYCTLTGLSIRGSCDQEVCAGIEIHGDFNTVTGCDIYDNVNGIYILDQANNNEIFQNKIHDNDFNFFVGSDPFDNLIYYNWFYNPNYFNAKDLGNNNWDNGFLGNSWDDYEGEDDDNNGIGDDPHPIPGAFNTDDYPIENDTKYPFNKPPTIGGFEGETGGTTGEKYGYAVKFYDDEYNDGILEMDWDDGSAVEYSPYLGAEEEYTFEHIFASDGAYNIKVRAIDTLGAKSDWENLIVSMPKQKNVNNLAFLFEKITKFFPIIEIILNKL